MFNDREAATVLRLAQELLQSGGHVGLTIRTSGRVEKPIPVFSPDGEHHSWFVPVVVDKLIAGFFEFHPYLTFMRYSSFQRNTDSLTGCSAAETWIDPEFIRQQIEQIAQADEKLIKLFLSYYGTSSRLAWKGILASHNESVRTVYVAGNTIWEE